jgi:hypothetical protein
MASAYACVSRSSSIARTSRQTDIERLHTRSRYSTRFTRRTAQNTIPTGRPYKHTSKTCPPTVTGIPLFEILSYQTIRELTPAAVRLQSTRGAAAPVVYTTKAQTLRRGHHFSDHASGLLPISTALS